LQSLTAAGEQAVVRHALRQGYLTSDQLRQALLLRAQLRSKGQAHDLLGILSGRYLPREHLPELSGVYRKALADAGAVTSTSQSGRVYVGRPNARPSGRFYVSDSAEAVTLPPPLEEVSEDALLASSEALQRSPTEDPAEVRGFMGALDESGRTGIYTDVVGAPGLPTLIGTGAEQDPASPQAFNKASGQFAGTPPTRTSQALRLGPPKRLGEYDLLRELARGAMGAVYEAHSPKLDRKVAVKVLLGTHAEQVERFQTEARAIARFRHPNIISIHEVGEDQGRHFLVMDLIEGDSILERVRREGPFDPKEAASIAEQLGSALHYAHSRSILHRDMKPENVLLTPEGEPLIIDFSLARDFSKEQRMTQTGQVMGTPAYMPPEQAQGDLSRIDRRADVYGLGATLYEMLTGQAPYRGSPMQVLSQVGDPRLEPPPPSKLRPGLDADLETICLKCLKKKPEQRYGTARILAQDLGRYLADEPILVRRRGAGERAQRWLRRNRGAAWALVTSGLLALAAASVAGAMAWRQPGVLDVESDPSGVRLSLRQGETIVETAETPARFRVPPGLYRVEVADPRFEVAVPGGGEVLIERGDHRMVDVAPRLRRGALSLEVEPPGALIHGTFLGPLAQELEASAPFQGEVAAGLWRLLLEHPGYLPLEVEVEVEAGGQTRLQRVLSERTLWTYRTSSSLQDMQLADLDGDDVHEVLAAGENGALTTLSAAGEVVWSHDPGTSRRSICVVSQDSQGGQDGEGGAPEVVSLVNDGLIVWLSGQGAVLRSLDTGEAVGSLLVSDLDADGAPELLFPQNDTLTCYASPSLVSRWVWRPDGPYERLRFAVADLDADGPSEVLITHGGQVTCLRADATLCWSRALELSEGSAPLAADLNGDGTLEILVAGKGVVHCLSAAGDMLWSYEDLPLPLLSPVVADLDGDGQPELVVALKGAGLVCLSMRGEALWRFIQPAGTEGRPHVSDLDGDGESEILQIVGQSEVVCLSANGRPRWRHRFEQPALFLGSADVDADGQQEVLVGLERALVCMVGASSPRRWSRRVGGDSACAPRAGPWSPLVGANAKLLGADGALHDVPVASASPPAWDADRERLLYVTAEGITAWRPGEDPTPLLLQRDLLCVTVEGDLGLAGTADGDLLAFDPQGQESWRVQLQGRLEARPTPLDLDTDGAVDHALACSSTGEVVLVTAAGEVVERTQLDSPVRFPALVVDHHRPALIIPAQERLVRIVPSHNGFRGRVEMPLDHALSMSPAALDEDGDGVAEVVAVGTWNGWLLGVSPGLDRVQWAYRDREAKYGPTGEVAVADLDGDGTLELACAWFRPTGASTRATLRLFSSQGQLLACLAAGRSPFRLAGGSQLPLRGLGDRAQAWGPWPATLARPPVPPPSLVHVKHLLVACVWEGALAEAAELEGFEAEILGALAAWGAGRRQPLRTLREENSRTAPLFLDAIARGLEGDGELRSALRVRQAMDPGSTSPPRMSTVSLDDTVPSAVAGEVDLCRDPATAPAEWKLEMHRVLSSDAGFSSQRHATGFFLMDGAALDLHLELPLATEDLRLQLLHSVVPAHFEGLPGFAALTVYLDDVPLIPTWSAPWRGPLEETLSLGAVDAGPHVLRLEVRDSATSFYSLRRLRLSAE
jgi:predicted Ser/Thr protein kinase